MTWQQFCSYLFLLFSIFEKTLAAQRFFFFCFLSSSQEASSFEFILRIDGDPLAIKRLPDKFAEFVNDVEPAKL
jgi:hypothetical protein